MSESLKSPFVANLENQWDKGNFVCVGLDPDLTTIPRSARKRFIFPTRRTIFNFNKEIIDATADLACAYKPNSAFYEGYGEQGMQALRKTVAYIKDKYPDVPVILDAKRGDVGNTNNGYVRSAFDDLGADAVTVNPYLGKEAMQPFLDRKDKGIIVLAKNSNEGSGEFQDLQVGEGEMPLYQVVARNVAESWNENGNCAVVVGATYPRELAQVREIVGDMPILIPGIGAQGGDLGAAVKMGKDSRGQGMLLSASRGIIYASDRPDFAIAARVKMARLVGEINNYRSVKV